jgi:hypothetical protein
MKKLKSLSISILLVLCRIHSLKILESDIHIYSDAKILQNPLFRLFILKHIINTYNLVKLNDQYNYYYKSFEDVSYCIYSNKESTQW